MKKNTKLIEFKEYLTKIEYLTTIEGVLYWDMRVNVPSKGVSDRGDILAYMSVEKYKLQTSDKMKEYIDYFINDDSLDFQDKKMVLNCKKEYELNSKIPEDRNKAYALAVAKSETAWEKAKQENDFEVFKPYLKEMIDFNREFVNYWGYKDNKYDTLLNIYEPGITVDKLDTIFNDLKNGIIDLLDKIKSSSEVINSSVFNKKFSKESQEEFSKFVLEKIGYDFEAGRLDETEHPFTIEFGNRDVRITTHYYQEDFKSALFSCIHEGGHGIYEQDIPDGLKGTLLGKGTSMGIHESQSRFYENILGRSLSFWKYFYPEAIKRFPQFEGVSLDEFYKGINEVKTSLIRTESDELTYSLHIIIRYELEKALINGELEIDDIKDAWNKKYKEYLNIEPSNDSEGILQDMHWSGGSFGYFPSYALGNLYGAQFLYKMKKEIPNIYDEIENGNFEIIHKYLNEKIHKYGSTLDPVEIIKLATGEELNSKYFIDYLNEKYKDIYKI
ncbi:MAG: carboxypeptidase M32 [Clostridiaceae bacterium]